MLDLFHQNIPPILHVRVTPRAKMEKIKREADKNGVPFFKIYVTAPPEDGKANKAVIALIAKQLDIAPSRISIVQGLTARDKVIAVQI